MYEVEVTTQPFEGECTISTTTYEYLSDAMAFARAADMCLALNISCHLVHSGYVILRMPERSVED